jgi:hypothetical protein
METSPADAKLERTWSYVSSVKTAIEKMVAKDMKRHAINQVLKRDWGAELSDFNDRERGGRQIDGFELEFEPGTWFNATGGELSRNNAEDLVRLLRADNTDPTFVGFAVEIHDHAHSIDGGWSLKPEEWTLRILLITRDR